jgi:hypothetical protein
MICLGIMFRWTGVFLEPQQTQIVLGEAGLVGFEFDPAALSGDAKKVARTRKAEANATFP